MEYKELNVIRCMVAEYLAQENICSEYTIDNRYSHRMEIATGSPTELFNKFMEYKQNILHDILQYMRINTVKYHDEENKSGRYVEYRLDFEGNENGTVTLYLNYMKSSDKKEE